MKIDKRHLSTLSIVAGMFLTIIGLVAISLYVYSSVVSLAQTDKSAIFWFLPFLFIGTTLVGAGVYFIYIGIKSFKNEFFYQLSVKSLAALSIIILISFTAIIISELSANKNGKAGTDRDLQTENHQEVTGIEITDTDETKVNISVKTHGENSGDYQFTLKAYNNQAVFLELSYDVTLNRSENELFRIIRFEDLFRKCLSEFKNSTIYICTENAGTRNSEMKIEAIIKPLQNSDAKFSISDLTSTGTASIYLDTFNDNGMVQVQHIRLE
jgi:signal transduction histidine kinase